MARNMNWLFPLALGVSTAAFAETVSVEIHPAPGAGLPKHMGTQVSPKQGRMEWDAMSLLKNGKPWLPVMGEIHFSRYPAAEWRDELLKMKAGGITMISTYVFWIYHEEERGKFTWDGDKDLRKFVQLCAEVGLPVIVRVGPWCHGEVRNGGFPDWVQAMAHKRTNDPEYLAAVKAYYTQVGEQLKGLYWKDDGPIIGIQFENGRQGGQILPLLQRLQAKPALESNRPLAAARSAGLSRGIGEHALLLELASC
ncbi:MAG TPA: beta-galactosidase [Phycisphaerae bacterium]|nr:beta-galactosidase [Phycisphaerae bacterium]